MNSDLVEPEESCFPWTFKPRTRFFKPGDKFFEEGDAACFQGTNHVVKEEEIEELLQCFSEINMKQLTIECDFKGCTKTFTSNQAYEWHQLSIHRFICKFCKRNFPSNFLLDLHITENHDSLFAARIDRGQDAFTCLIQTCLSKFCSEEERNKHLIEVHKYPSDFRFRRRRKHEGYKSKSSLTPSSVEKEEFAMEIESPKKDDSPKEREGLCHSDNGLDIANEKGKTDEASQKRNLPKTISFGRGNSRAFPRNRTSKKN